MTRVEAHGRLHFGLLSLRLAGDENAPGRRFGGVGLMIDEPKMVVRVAPACEWSASGPNAARALDCAQRFSATLPAERQQRFAIEVEQSYEPHSGLGSGTAIALAVAKALACECGYSEWQAVELAKRVGRGERSAIGVHGFGRGGLIVEGGKEPGERMAPLAAHHDFPEDWRIALLRPRVEPHWHGSRERDAFARLDRDNPTDRLCRLVVTGMLPALASKNLNAFGEALHEYNALAGTAFATEQGGVYANEAVAAIIDFVRKLGVKGVGQSSWGPTVFAVVDEETAQTLLRAPRAIQADVRITKAVRK